MEYGMTFLFEFRSLSVHWSRFGFSSIISASDLNWRRSVSVYLLQLLEQVLLLPSFSTDFGSTFDLRLADELDSDFDLNLCVRRRNPRLANSSSCQSVLSPIPCVPNRSSCKDFLLPILPLANTD